MQPRTLILAAAFAAIASVSQAATPARSVAGQPWENTLGMKFVAVPGVSALFGVWDVRVKDFEAFVKSSGHDATAGMASLRADGHRPRGDTWKSPGFAQGPTHPVCGVSWEDAQAFCAWLTKQEQAAGRLGASQKYRLPTDAEWSLAVGLNEPGGGTPQSKSWRIKNVYPWGTQWPPPRGAGNYAGTEARDANWPANFSVIDGYKDDFARTSPVGSFAANKYGLYDMGGNVWQWCEDFYDGTSGARVVRGASFGDDGAGYLLSSYRYYDATGVRYGGFGFRCVVVVASSP